MFYFLLKLYARLALHIYCRKILVNKPEMLKAEGPLLLAANHPNSFLDGIIMTTVFKNGVHSLARGDAFKNSRVNRFLRSIFLLPVYRTSEGVENLGHNYTTFASCQQVFQKGGIVIIFSEGRCINEWHLRPLKKGTARLAISSWQKGIPLTVVPVGFNYSPFRVFGKNVHIHFGDPLPQQAILEQEGEGKQLLHFNEHLENSLKGLVYEIDPNDRIAIAEKLGHPTPLILKVLLALPAIAGAIIHAPLYYLVKWFTDKHFDNDHWDSVFNSLAVLLYPIYLLLLCGVAWAFTNFQVALASLVLLPFTAWAYVQVKNQVK
ncbi:MAG TPA: 1-acyl-sn-glycerol-3-phosphate acyltransferase [Flavisolibacter sp.]